MKHNLSYKLRAATPVPKASVPEFSPKEILNPLLKGVNILESYRLEYKRKSYTKNRLLNDSISRIKHIPRTKRQSTSLSPRKQQ